MALTLQRMHESGAHFIPYGSLYALPATLPGREWDNYAEIWRTERPGGAIINATWARPQGIPVREPSAHYICLHPKSVRDFIVWTHVQALDRYDTDGLYFDLAAPNSPCRNPRHAQPPAEEDVQYYPVWWQRQLMKRLWVACKSRRPEYLIAIHHAKCPITVSGFADLVLSGEALNMFFKGDDFSVAAAAGDPAAYVPDYGRVPDVLTELQYSQTLGVINTPLPEIKKWNRELMEQRPDLLERYTRTLLAHVVALDIPVYPSMMDMHLFDAVMAARQQFGGIADAQFVPPSESERLLAGAPAALTVAMHLRPGDTKLLLAASNLTDQPIWETVRLHPQALADAGVSLPPDAALTDAIAGEPLPGDLATGWRVDVPPQDFRLLLLGSDR